MFRKMLRRLTAFVITLLLGSVLGAALLWSAPGAASDDRELDPRLSAESIKAIRAERVAAASPVRFYLGYLRGLVTGDFGVSQQYGRPVREILAERIPVTARAMAWGIAAGWLLGLALATGAVVGGIRAFSVVGSTLSGAALGVPVAVLALLFLFTGAPPEAALALVVFPRVYRFAANLLREALDAQHVLAARARGATSTSILMRHILPGVAGPLAALAGVSVSIAFGAAIPVEVVCDLPGLGQLAWQAAMARDLPILVNVTFLATLLAVTASLAADSFVGNRGAQVQQ